MMWVKPPGVGSRGCRSAIPHLGHKSSCWWMRTPQPWYEQAEKTAQPNHCDFPSSFVPPRRLCKPPGPAESIPLSQPGRAHPVRFHQGCIWLVVTDALGYSSECSSSPGREHTQMGLHPRAFVFCWAPHLALKFGLEASCKESWKQ